MKIKTIITALALMACSTLANAEYKVIIGPQKIQGDNISFVTGTSGNGNPPVVTPPPPPAPVEECSTDHNVSRWVAGSPSFAVLYIIWDGQKLFENGLYRATEYTIGGYKYTKKEQVVNYGSYTFSKVCRIAFTE